MKYKMRGFQQVITKLLFIITKALCTEIKIEGCTWEILLPLYTRTPFEPGDYGSDVPWIGPFWEYVQRVIDQK